MRWTACSAAAQPLIVPPCASCMTAKPAAYMASRCASRASPPWRPTRCKTLFCKSGSKRAVLTPSRGAASAWLASLARYRSIDIVRRLQREQPGYEAPEQADTSPDALSQLVGSVEAEALRRCLATLDEKRRQLVLMAFVEGLSHTELAERLATPLGSIKSMDPPLAGGSQDLPQPMSGTEGDDDRDLLAAEYVLGTLDPLERGYVERQATLDDGLAHLIADWQARLTPLTLLSPPMAPPAQPVATHRTRHRPCPPGSHAVLAKASRCGAAPPGLDLPSPPRWSSSWCCTHQKSPRRSPRWPPVSGGAPVFVAETASDGTLRLQPIAPITVAAGRDPGAVVAARWWPPDRFRWAFSRRYGRNSRLPSLAPRTQLLVSLEPAGGSPTGQPTGPVVYGGTLFRIE